MIDRVILAVTIAMLVSALPGGTVRADSARDYWPAWRGPMACGVSATGKPPLTWSETQNIKWKVPVPGEGTSSPIVWGDRIFFLTAIETNRLGTPAPVPGAVVDPIAPPPFHGGKRPKTFYKFDVVCLERATGRILWEKTAREEVPHEGHSPEHGFASYSPVTDGVHVWAAFGSRGVHCYDVNGAHRWSRDLGRMTTKLMFGEGTSPALAGNEIFLKGEKSLYCISTR